MSAAAAAACGNGAEGDTKPYPAPTLAKEGEVVAKVGPTVFTSAEIEKRMNSQNPFMRQRLSDPKNREEWMERELRFEILAQEGWRRGLYKDPEIIAALKKAIVQRIVREEMKRLTTDIEITEAQLRTSYSERTSEFNKPERIRLSQIVRYVETSTARAEARKSLAQAKRRIVIAEKKNDASAFAKEARALSEDEATKKSGGDLQFTSKVELAERYGPEVAELMFVTAKIGDTVQAEAENAVLLLKKTGRRRAVTRTVGQVKPQLRARLLNEKKNERFNAFIKGLWDGIGVTYSTETLSKLEIDLSAPSAPVRSPR